MENIQKLIQDYGVAVQNSVLVSGLTDTAADEEVYNFLEQYGSILQKVKSKSDLYVQVIVEYKQGLDLEPLMSKLPITNTTKTDQTYHVESLASACTPAFSQSATQTYLTELKQIAKQSGQNFEDVLRKELSRISGAVGQDEEEPETHTDDREERVVDDIPQVSPQPSALTPQHVQEPTHSQQPQKEKTQRTISLTELYPSDMQKVVVEHIVKHEDSTAQAHASLRLRPFSGRIPRPNNEVDYETWRSNADFLLGDVQQSDLHKSRRIQESLLSPAVDIVKHLTPYSPPSMYLEILDSAFGTVEDGDDLYFKFLNTLQDYNEKPSTYLQRLQVMLNTTLRRGGVKATDLDRQLLKQFCRGCYVNALISELKLEDKDKKDNPPTFAELLLLLRTEEEKRYSKECRIKQHFSATKQKVSSHFQGAYGLFAEECNTSPQSCSEPSSEIQDLKKQIAQLQSQLTKMTQKDKTHSKKAPKKPTTSKSTDESARPQKPQSSNSDAKDKHSNKPRPWYCFRCGEDGHIKPQCEAEPNSSLVATKRKLLKERQLEWESKHGSTESDDLNF